MPAMKRTARSGYSGRRSEKARMPLMYDAVRLVFVVLLCGMLALIIQETWLDYRDYAALERTRQLMASVTPTPVPPATPAPTPKPITTKSPTAPPPPTPTPRVYVISSRFSTLLAQNPDTIGWITIADTPIDYPVVQSDDNEHYLHISFDGNESKAGTLFLDYRCEITSEFPPHFIIYGHHMKNGSMFKALMRFKEKDFFSSHRTFRFDTLYEDMEWEIFSAYVTEAVDPYIRTRFDSDEEWLAFLNDRHARSMHVTPDITLSQDDIVLTLSTCTYEFKDARFVVHARLVRDARPPQDAGSAP
jgi:sortase B